MSAAAVARLSRRFWSPPSSSAVLLLLARSSSPFVPAMSSTMRSFGFGVRSAPRREGGGGVGGGSARAAVEPGADGVPPEPPIPPVPRRDESLAAYAGVAPPGWDPSLPRRADGSTEKLLDPPVPIPDPYGWLRDDDRKDEEVLAHLRKENEYSQAVTRGLKGMQEGLYEEFLSRIRETDHSTPRPHGKHWYYTRTFEGSSYKTYCRAPKTTESLPPISWDGTKEAPILPGEEAYLDVNKLAEGTSYCSVGTVETSPSGTLIAYAVDFSGDEKYELRVRDLATGEDVALKGAGSDEPLEVDDAVWGADDDALYYVTVDDQHRPYRLYQRRGWRGGSPVDALLKEEPDDLYWCDVSKSLDEKYVFFGMASKETSEVWYLSVEDEKEEGPPDMKCVAPRRNKVLYEVEHGSGSWIIWTNEGRLPNMKLVSAPATPDSAGEWKLVEDASGRPIFDGSLAKSLDSVTVLNTHLVAQGREGGIPRIWIYDLASKEVRRLEFEEAAYDVGMLAHFEPDATTIAISYDSMVTPTSSIEIALEDDAKRTVLKARVVPGYDKDAYGCDRLEVTSRDGKTQIPISVMYRKETMEKVKGGERVPVHLYGYGSYGSCMEADFDATRLPLIDRGMIYVIAHIRGGGEMGRQWYEEPNGGKYLCKKNTFRDFVDVARFLASKWTTPDMLSCEGRSAGGLLIGAALNEDPELFRAAILGVPFVDVAVTMTDATIPLTSGEWVEWGNPNEEKFFSYMLGYSPMNQIKAGRKYPSMWITGGLHDPRVAYWEPSKYAATLRHANPDSENPVCLKLDLSAGHFSASDRYKYYRELAYDFSFLLDQLGLADQC